MRARAISVAAGIFRPADFGRTEYVLARRLLRLLREAGGFNIGLRKVKDIARTARMMRALHPVWHPKGVDELRCPRALESSSP
jgi:hypothetical protein